ncbi:unnamed protein product [Echinostoma caproni]|uniref:Transposase n=1 Tax=Echinostoma caproni TaxID=27848 RepID=A0A183A6Z8_9TREM|nr:unnamed protein product [Echinostoma caproni]
MGWDAAKDDLISGFDTMADSRQSFRGFRTVQLGVGVDALSHAVALRALLTLPTLDDAGRSDLLLERFLKSLPGDLCETA